MRRGGIYRCEARQYLNLLHLAFVQVPSENHYRWYSGVFAIRCDAVVAILGAVMPVLTSGQTRFDDAIIRTEMRSALSLATTLDEISVLIYDGLQFGNARL